MVRLSVVIGIFIDYTIINKNSHSPIIYAMNIAIVVFLYMILMSTFLGIRWAFSNLIMVVTLYLLFHLLARTILKFDSDIESDWQKRYRRQLRNFEPVGGTVNKLDTKNQLDSALRILGEIPYSGVILFIALLLSYTVADRRMDYVLSGNPSEFGSGDKLYKGVIVGRTASGVIVFDESADTVTHLSWEGPAAVLQLGRN